MTSSRINNTIIDELKRRVVNLEANHKALINNAVVTLPLRDETNLPTEAGDGEIVLASDGKAYKYQDGEWAPIGGAGSYIDVVSTPGKLSVFEGTARSYMNDSGTITLIHCSVGVPSEGADIVTTVKKNGTGIGTCTILEGEYFGAVVPDPADYVSGDYFTNDIDQVGSPGTTGRDLVTKLF